jgi:hypothetical protein
MKRSGLRKITIVAGAGAVATVGILALNPFSASATTDAVATTTTVTGPASVATGHAVTFTATVSPNTTGSKPVVKATGGVTFTITGSGAASATCTNIPAVNGKGKAVCKVAAGSLLASASPYSVTAVYQSDGTFAGSTGNASEPVTQATAHVKLSYDVKPVSGAATTFTATVTGGGGAMPTGTVQFTVAADGPNGKLVCNPGGKNQPLSASSDPTPVAEATCSLSAGWLKTATKGDPHPSWAVAASYSGDGNFASNSATIRGTAKS